MRAALNLFSDGEVEAICDAARRVLSAKGLRFVIPEVLGVFKKHGFSITDGDVVHIGPKAVLLASEYLEGSTCMAFPPSVLSRHPSW